MKNKIEYKDGDIFASYANTFINPVSLGNTWDGLAKRFNERYPEACESYRRDKRKYFPYTDKIHFRSEKFKTIVCLPVKWHYSNDADIVLIKYGLYRLSAQLHNLSDPIAIPDLRCGSSDLEWEDIMSLINEYLYDPKTETTILNKKIYVFPQQ